MTAAAIVLGLAVAGCSGGGGGSGGGGATGPLASGAVLDYRDRPLAGAPIRVRRAGATAVSAAGRVDPLGRALVGGLPAAPVVVEVGDSIATPTMLFRVDASGGAPVVPLGRPLFVPGIDTGASAPVQSGLAAFQVVSDTTALAGVALSFAPGTVVTYPPGVPGVVRLIGVAPDRLPEPLPGNLAARLAVLVEPAGARFAPGATLTLPNLDGLAPGATADLHAIDPLTGAWQIVGSMTVDAGGGFLTGGPVEVGTLYALPDPAAPALTTVTGRIVGPGPQPLAGWSVAAGSAFAVTGPDGTFTLPNVDADGGNIVVRASAPPDRMQPELIITGPLAPVPGGTTDAGDLSAQATPLDRVGPVPAFTPAAGAGNVNENTTIRIVFNEPIDFSTLSLRVVGTNGSVPGVIAPAADRASVTFTPLSPLDNGESYQTVLSAATTDLSGNPVDDSQLNARFTTRGGGGAPSADVVLLGVAPFEAEAGETIAAFGRNFPGGSAVTVGGVAAQVLAETASQVTFVVPANAPAGDQPVRVSSTTNAGASSTLRVFGRVTRIVPSLIAQGSGTQVMISGRNIGQASQVHFDGQPSGGLAVVDAQTVVASAPAGARSGPVVVRQSGAAPDARSYRFLVVSD